MDLQTRNANIEQLFLQCSDIYDDQTVYMNYCERVSNGFLFPEQAMFNDIEALFGQTVRGYTSSEANVIKRLIMLFAHIGAIIERKAFFEKYGNDPIVEYMTPDWFIKTHCWYALKNKGGDYEEDGDSYKNFKDSSSRTGVTPRQLLMGYADKQFGVVKQALRSGNYKTLSDSVCERIADIINYLAMYWFMPGELTTIDNQPELPFVEEPFN